MKAIVAIWEGEYEKTNFFPHMGMISVGVSKAIAKPVWRGCGGDPEVVGGCRRKERGKSSHVINPSFVQQYKQ